MTRSLLQVLSDFSHPVAVMTRGTLVMRDADLLGP